MKKINLLLIFVCINIAVNAQKFMRYNINNETYNGFYTGGIDSITHKEIDGIIKTTVHTNGKDYEIPIDQIGDITIESANITEGNIGEYKVYELHYEEGNIKKVYVDNRACLFASKNGDFGANDEILFLSAYNETQMLFRTNDEGQVTLISDGKKFLEFEYKVNDDIIIYNVDTEDGIAEQQLVKLNTLKSRASAKPIANFFTRLRQSFTNPITADEIGEFIGERVSDVLMNAVTNLDEIQNNPENHTRTLIINGLNIAGDVVGIGTTLLAGFPTNGLTWAALGFSVHNLYNDTLELINNSHPSYERIMQYMRYYQEHYNLTLSALAPVSVTYNSATLRGDASADTELNGDFSFYLFEVNNHTNENTLRAMKTASGPYHCSLTVSTNSLKPGTDYAYWMYYDIVVDGIRLHFKSDYAEFKTIDTPLQMVNRKNQIKYSNDVVTAKLTGQLILCENSDKSALSSFQEYGVYLFNTITETTDFYPLDVDENNEFSITVDIPRSKFDKDYSTFVATCNKLQLGVYAVDNSSKASSFYRVTPNIRYTTKPSVTFKEAEITGTEVLSYDEENGKTEYRSFYTLRTEIKGTFWFDNIQYIISGWNRIGDGMYNTPKDGTRNMYMYLHYWSNSSMYHYDHFQFFLNNGSIQNSTNGVTFGGTPGNPTVTINSSLNQMSLSFESINEVQTESLSYSSKIDDKPDEKEPQFEDCPVEDELQ